MTEIQLSDAVFSKIAEQTDFITEQEDTQIGKERKEAVFDVFTVAIFRCQNC